MFHHLIPILLFLSQSAQHPAGSSSLASTMHKMVDRQLIRSVEVGDKASVVHLLQWGADPNAVNQFGCSALFWAVYFREDDVVKLLVKGGAKVNCLSGPQPAHQAVVTGQDDLLIFLIKNGANTDKLDAHGNTLLHLSVGSHRTSTAKVLLSAGVSPLIRNKFGKTALDIAKRQGDLPFVELLSDAEKKSRVRSE